MSLSIALVGKIELILSIISLNAFKFDEKIKF